MEVKKIHKEILILKSYALISSLLLAVLIFMAAKQSSSKTTFKEIDVERINIVEKDGKLRLAISNRDLSPGPIIGGMYMKTREGQRPGMIFFNDKGDECGGMTWGSREKDGQIRANAGLMFDQYNQDQTVGITYSQRDASRTAGLRVWDRPLTPLADFARELSDIESLPDGPEKTEALKKLRKQAVDSGLAGVSRVFVGRGAENQAIVSLSDTKGKPRILMSVDGDDIPSLQFLDENGQVVYKFPVDSKQEKEK
jgi:hypothetical protein